MPIIRSSADLRNNYNGIAKMCHECNEPVFITKNGKGDLAVMSMETYEKLSSKFELATLLEKALKEVKNGETFDLDDIFKETSSLYK